VAQIVPTRRPTKVHARAAREKIASDPAYDLGLTLPPAVLTIRENPPTDCARFVVVTLALYPRQWRWTRSRG